jgi:hypothetical protein
MRWIVALIVSVFLLNTYILKKLERLLKGDNLNLDKYSFSIRKYQAFL